MPRPCRACRSSHRAQIDEALAGGDSFRGVAKRFGISPAALFRHKSNAHKQRPDEAIPEEYRAEYHKKREAYERARKTGDDCVLALAEFKELLQAIKQQMDETSAGLSTWPPLENLK